MLYEHLFFRLDWPTTLNTTFLGVFQSQGTRLGSSIIFLSLSIWTCFAVNIFTSFDVNFPQAMYGTGKAKHRSWKLGSSIPTSSSFQSLTVLSDKTFANFVNVRPRHLQTFAHWPSHVIQLLHLATRRFFFEVKWISTCCHYRPLIQHPSSYWAK